MKATAEKRSPMKPRRKKNNVPPPVPPPKPPLAVMWAGDSKVEGRLEQSLSMRFFGKVRCHVGL